MPYQSFRATEKYDIVLPKKNASRESIAGQLREEISLLLEWEHTPVLRSLLQSLAPETLLWTSTNGRTRYVGFGLEADEGEQYRAKLLIDCGRRVDLAWILRAVEQAAQQAIRRYELRAFQNCND